MPGFISREQFPWEEDSLDRMELYGHLFDQWVYESQTANYLRPGPEPVPEEVMQFEASQYAN